MFTHNTAEVSVCFCIDYCFHSCHAPARGVMGIGIAVESLVPKVSISGVHSDPDPSPGVGVGRSLRDAFPNASITAVDYSVRSSGLHHPVFNDVLLQSPWGELDLPLYASQIREHLSAPSNCWISGLDVEIDWLADVIGEHPRLLIPSPTAQRAVRKPGITAAESICMKIPRFASITAGPTELHALGRRTGWRLWLKAKYHDASCIRSLDQLYQQIREFEEFWPREDLFVQEHVIGQERSFAFAAYAGRLLDAVEVEKSSVTSRGKTWSATVTEANAGIRDRLATFIAEVRWTGGGEVEFIRDQDGTDWLIDFNPRFPAYIHGVTLCGHNLPALLVGAAIGLDVSVPRNAARQFIRVVHELPVREEYPIPQMINTSKDLTLGGKHPSFQPLLPRHFKKTNHRRRFLEPASDHAPLPAFLANWRTPPHTPFRFREFTAAQAMLDRLAAAIESCEKRPAICPALSVKTDPHPELAQAFLERGWRAEVISLQELDWANKAGFAPSQLVFNGPSVVDLASSTSHQVGVAFADSLQSFERLLKSQPFGAAGIRLRPNGIKSRFGIDLTDHKVFNHLVSCLAECPPELQLGLHVHSASDMCGPSRWNDIVHHTLVWAEALSIASGRNFSVLDIGGGWHADDFQDLFLPRLRALQEQVACSIPNASVMILEPGKAIAADSAWLVTKVKEVRARPTLSSADVVVDAAISDLPMARHYAHRILQIRDGQCLGWLIGGEQRILGSICMEMDILAQGVSFPRQPRPGDEVLFSSAGGYNSSMAWHFAAGVSRDV